MRSTGPTRYKEIFVAEALHGHAGHIQNDLSGGARGIPLPGEEYVSDVRREMRGAAAGAKCQQLRTGAARRGTRGVRETEDKGAAELLNIVINVAFTFCARR